MKSDILTNVREYFTPIKIKQYTYFLFFTALLTSVIASQNFFFQSIIDNGISKRDVIAQKTITVVDTQRTEQHKKELSQKVEPILAPAEDDFIKTNLQTLQSSIIQIRKKIANKDVKKSEISVLFDIYDPVKKEFVIEFLLGADETSLKEVFDKSILTLNNILQKGITEKEYEKGNIDKIIRTNMIPNVSRRQVTLITSMLDQVIVPNLVVDEFATEIARKNVQNSVKPYETVFQKGDKILFEGEPVTRLKRDALRLAGYNIYELNLQGITSLFILVFICSLLFVIYMKYFEKTLIDKNHMFILSVLTIMLALIAAVMPVGASPYFLPIPALMIIVSIFTNPRVAFVLSAAILVLLSAGFQYDLQFLTTFLMLSLFVAIAMAKIQYAKRVDLLKAGVNISIAGVIFVTSLYFMEKCLIDVDNILFIKNVVYIALNGMISTIIALGTLPMFENIFKIVTPYGLAELADANQPLLKRLFKEAQGTYNHSLMVSSLCEAAAEAIGADPVLARVGALYHDIGKLKRPMFFVENQSYFQIGNPHSNLDNPRLSKMVITAHTKDGIELAKKYGLPPVINNFILQHHGEGLASYFYNQAVQEEGAENVNEEQFRYTGPKPNMKETAILMLADAIESAVRSMKNPTSEDIDSVIDKIIVERLNDGQLSDSPLTLKDIKVIATTFSKMLRGMRHERIKYQENLMEELKKEKINIPKRVFDVDLENKIKELESGKPQIKDENDTQN